MEKKLLCSGDSTIEQRVDELRREAVDRVHSGYRRVPQDSQRGESKVRVKQIRLVTLMRSDATCIPSRRQPEATPFPQE